MKVDFSTRKIKELTEGRVVGINSSDGMIKRRLRKVRAWI